MNRKEKSNHGKDDVIIFANEKHDYRIRTL
jgi:hypothetical protein